jgi:hypothetical protein
MTRRSFSPHHFDLFTLSLSVSPILSLSEEKQINRFILQIPSSFHFFFGGVREVS